MSQNFLFLSPDACWDQSVHPCLPTWKEEEGMERMDGLMLVNKAEHFICCSVTDLTEGGASV